MQSYFEEDSKVFGLFLKYLYTDKLPKENITMNEAIDLCYLSDFYGLENNRLIHLAEGRIQVDQSNVLSLLDTSEKLGAKRIKAMCLKFIANNFEIMKDKIMETIDKELLISIIEVKSELEYK